MQFYLKVLRKIVFDHVLFIFFIFWGFVRHFRFFSGTYCCRWRHENTRKTVKTIFRQNWSSWSRKLLEDACRNILQCQSKVKTQTFSDFNSNCFWLIPNHHQAFLYLDNPNYFLGPLELSELYHSCFVEETPKNLQRNIPSA